MTDPTDPAQPAETKPKKRRRAPKDADELTAQVQSDIVQAIAAGAFIETAAAYAGVQKETLRTWLRRANAETRGPFRAFKNAIDRALATAEVADLARIAQASQSFWQAAAWRLERRFPEKYSLSKIREDQALDANAAQRSKHVVEIVCVDRPAVIEQREPEEPTTP